MANITAKLKTDIDQAFGELLRKIPKGKGSIDGDYSVKLRNFSDKIECTIRVSKLSGGISFKYYKHGNYMDSIPLSLEHWGTSVIGGRKENNKDFSAAYQNAVQKAKATLNTVKDIVARQYEKELMD